MKIALRKLVETREELREFKNAKLMFPFDMAFGIADAIRDFEGLLSAFDTAKSNKIAELGKKKGPNVWSIELDDNEAVEQFLAYMEKLLKMEFVVEWEPLTRAELESVGAEVPIRFLVDLDYLFAPGKDRVKPELDATGS